MPTSRRPLLALPFAAALPARAAELPQSLLLPEPSTFSSHGGFYMEVFKLALRKAAPGQALPQIRHAPSDTPRERLRQMLFERQLDLAWSATTPERESQALPVRFNLLKGTNELRFLLVRAADLPRLRGLRSLEQLRRLRAGAGTYWSDTLILRANGFTVETSPKFPQLFRMLKAGRFDFMPRTRDEIDLELSLHASEGLAEWPDLALQYRQPIYFFVSKAQPELAERLNRGLALAAADGSFDAAFNADPVLRAALAHNRAYAGLRLTLKPLAESGR